MPGASVRAASLLLVLLACARVGERADSEAEVHVPEAARLTAPVADSGLAWTIDSVPVTRIGAAEGDTAQHFRFVNRATRLSDGTVVLLVDSRVARWFDSTGRHTGATTRDGDGPGEFRSVGSLERLAGDTVLVAASDGTRRGLFDATGRLLRHETLDYRRYRLLARWTECRTQVLTDRSVVSCAPDPTIPASATNRPNRVVRSGWTSPGPGLLRQLRRAYLATPALDTALPLGIEAGIEQFGVRVGTGERFLIHPFYSHSIVVAGGTPPRVAMALNPAYRVEVWSTRGALLHVLTRDVRRHVPSPAERDSAVRWMRGREGRFLDRALLDRAIAQVPVPDSLPAILDLVVSDLGEVVVTRYGSFFDGERVADVYDADGRWAGVLRLPPRSRLLELGRTHAVLARRDDDDLQVVEVYRLRR
jgi:hypothetical protein